MKKHEKLHKEKFSHAVDDFLYNSGGNVMWSLFSFENGGVTIYYHDIDEFDIIHRNNSRWHSLTEIADNWDPISKKIHL